MDEPAAPPPVVVVVVVCTDGTVGTASPVVVGGEAVTKVAGAVAGRAGAFALLADPVVLGDVVGDDDVDPLATPDPLPVFPVFPVLPVEPVVPVLAAVVLDPTGACEAPAEVVTVLPEPGGCEGTERAAGGDPEEQAARITDAPARNTGRTAGGTRTTRSDEWG